MRIAANEFQLSRVSVRLPVDDSRLISKPNKFWRGQ